MTQRWIITALGADRPGIVAGVAHALYRFGCNLEDSAMTRLEGEFAIMLIFSAPATLSARRLERAFAPLSRRFKLAVHLKPLSRREGLAPRRQGTRYQISVYGADRPGIVMAISQALARRGVNITDVHTHRSVGRPPFLYLMLLDAEVPKRLRVAALEQQLKALAKRLRVQVSLRPSEATVL